MMIKCVISVTDLLPVTDGFLCFVINAIAPVNTALIDCLRKV